MTKLPNKRGRLLNLPKSALIPDLTFDQNSENWGEVKLAWNKTGLGIGLKVDKKQHPATAAEKIQVWIDTRDTKAIHRANRYCHLFEINPVPNVESKKKAECKQHPIHRAQADAPLGDLSKIQIWTKFQTHGYELDVWFPTSVLNGYDPSSSPQLGFYYTIADSELGDQFMTVDHEFPYEQDPSLWATLRLETSN